MVLIIDPQNAGIAGNMVAGAFIDLGANFNEVKDIMESVSQEFGGGTVNISKVNKKGIEASYLEFSNDNDLGENENADYFSINYNEFIGKIDKLKTNIDDLLTLKVFKTSKNVFKRIAISESKIHGKSLDKIHFHEVGAADAVADVFGSIYAYYQLGFENEKIIGLPVALGGGTIVSSHGRIPVPSPATLDILNGINCFGGPVNEELATPTGSALFTELCDDFKEFQPAMSPNKVAYGAGKKDLDFPNVLRMIRGSSLIDVEKIDVIETNIDHLTGESMGYLFDKLFEAGAKDVFITPTIMKKNRPGNILNVISQCNDTDNLLSVIFEETGTLGIRISPQKHRGVADRKIVSINVDFNSYLDSNYQNKNNVRKIRFKIGLIESKIVSIRPEYEDVKKIAIELNIPLTEVNKIGDIEIKNFLKM
jgi:uncharacterized protein (TIGR00299 family) protein